MPMSNGEDCVTRLHLDVRVCHLGYEATDTFSGTGPAVLSHFFMAPRTARFLCF